MGEREHLLSPAVDLNLHIQDVVNVLDFENLSNVILAGHSYTGMVITGVADRALGHIGQLVYLDATIPRDGESQADVIPEAMAIGKTDSKMVDGLLMAMVPGSLFYEECRKHLKKYGYDWMIQRIRPLPYFGCYETKLSMRNPAAVLNIPTTAVRCSQNPWEPKQLERMRRCDNYWEIDTVHDMMISEPEKTAEMLLRLA
jgi:pimeloyl-ACP methyl ester carboxylesterase